MSNDRRDLMSDQDSPRSEDEDRSPVSPTTDDESQGSWTSSYRGLDGVGRSCRVF